MSYVNTIEELKLDGGVACLDFVNSAVDVEEDVVLERLKSYEDLLTLARRTEILDNATLKSLRGHAAADPAQAAAEMEKMRKVRQDLYEIFVAVATRRLKQLDASILQRFNKSVTWALTARRFGVTKNILDDAWDTDLAGLSLPLRAFLFSAQQLLLDQPHELIKKCESCAWLFLDTSKSHRRKWCDMQTCGSAAKSKRYYRKKTKDL